MATETELRRAWCKESVLNFSRYMFRRREGVRYNVGDHIRRIATALDDVARGACRRLIINIAPRYGKTELVSKMFIAYGLALNPRAQFLHLSYSDDLVLSNSRAINELLRADYFREIFPETAVSTTNAKRWNTTAGGGVYAVSTAGQVTGFGAGRVAAEDEAPAVLPGYVSGPPFNGAIVIDDPLKPTDAMSDLVREDVNFRFEHTIRSRVNDRATPIVIIMQRLHEQDLCGYLTTHEPGVWRVLSLPCLTVDADGNERALFEKKHTVAELHELERVNPFVFETQYQQNPTPLEGLMYSGFAEYDTLPVGQGVARNYTDTADTGADYLCSVCYVEFPTGLYVTDLLYTQRPMEYTEPETARMMDRNATVIARIESNNGGRGFARNVERNLRELGNRRTRIEPFTQTQNKQVRIFTRSAEVVNMIRFPRGWRQRWPQFASALTSYRKEGRNAHDDAPDVLTGMIESIAAQNTTRYSRT